MAGNEAGLAMAHGAEALGRGDLERAATAFAAAVAADPGLADGWFNLGWVQRALRRFDAALDSYAKALGAGIAGPEEVHVNRAAILSEHLHDAEAAADALRAALALVPGYPPALHGLAQLHEDAGRREEAAACYRTALAAAPGDGRARARLALLDAAGSDPAQAAAGLEAQLARTAPPEDRAELLFAVAVLRDQARDHSRAFAAAREANALAARLSPAQYDPAAFEAFVDRTIATFAEPLPAPATRAGPVFLCGLFRSGSTLAEQILGRHPALTAAGELEAIPAMAQAVPAYPEGTMRLAEADVAALRAQYAAEARRAAPTAAARTIDKRCDNALHLGLVRAVLPEALVVRTRRHPLDTLLSTFFLRFGDGVPYGHRLDHAVHHAIHHERLMRHWDRVMPERIVDLDYDRLVRDPRAALEPVLAHLGLDWDDRLLDPRVGGSVRTASNWQVRQPLHARSSGRWRHYAAELAEARRQFLAAGVALPD